jgi:hypothetical protein
MTAHRALCLTCSLPLSSNLPIDSCHECGSSNLFLESHEGFDAAWRKRNEPPAIRSTTRTPASPIFDDMLDASSFGSPQAKAIRTIGTSGGLPITDESVREMADEAEAGYEPDQLSTRKTLFTVSQLEAVHKFMLLKPCPYCEAKINEECTDGVISDRFHGVHKVRYQETLDTLGHHNSFPNRSVATIRPNAKRRTYLKG